MCGCTPEDNPFVFRWEGEHVEVWSSEQLEPCQGAIDYSDRHARRLIEELTANDVASVGYTQFFWADERDWELAPCPDGLVGCDAGGGEVYSRQLPHTHELNHAIVVGGVPFLDEGLATLYGDDLVTFSKVPRPRIDEALTRSYSEIPEGLYPHAALFVRLILEHEPQEGLAAISQTRPGMSYAEVVDTFAVYGIDFETLVEAYETTETCGIDGIRIPITECSIDSAPWSSPELWEVELRRKMIARPADSVPLGGRRRKLPRAVERLRGGGVPPFWSNPLSQNESLTPISARRSLMERPQKLGVLPSLWWWREIQRSGPRHRFSAWGLTTADSLPLYSLAMLLIVPAPWVAMTFIVATPVLAPGLAERMIRRRVLERRRHAQAQLGRDDPSRLEESPIKRLQRAKRPDEVWTTPRSDRRETLRGVDPESL